MSGLHTARRQQLRVGALRHHIHCEPCSPERSDASRYDRPVARGAVRQPLHRWALAYRKINTPVTTGGGDGGIRVLVKGLEALSVARSPSEAMEITVPL